MSRYKDQPLDFSRLKTIPLADRGGKVTVAGFAAAYTAGSVTPGRIDSLPHLLAADHFRAVIAALAEARAKKRAILWGLGGHVIKCGLAPVLVDLMRRGYATGFALNGWAAIHDFEIAIAGHTSEDVEAALPDGRFGSAEETGREINCAIAEAAREGTGLGEARARILPSTPASLLAGASAHATPVTVHVAIGTDTPHTHPAADPAAIGAATHRAFRLFCTLVAGLHDGGGYVNLGSAVVMPEVFLKALSAVRNLGHPVGGFTTANFDFLQHYRPRINVVERPHAAGAGKGYAITGHHELMRPLLHPAQSGRDPE